MVINLTKAKIIKSMGYAIDSILMLVGELGLILTMGPILISFFVTHKNRLRIPKDNRNIYTQNRKYSFCLLME